MGMSGTMLLIEDEELVRGVVQRMLERLGFTVLTAEDGRAGVDLFRAHTSEIVGVLLDMSMPHLSGEETFHLLRQINPDIRIILMSGQSKKAVLDRFPGQQLAGVLPKPFTFRELQAMLQAGDASRD